MAADSTDAIGGTPESRLRIVQAVRDDVLPHLASALSLLYGTDAEAWFSGPDTPDDPMREKLRTRYRIDRVGLVRDEFHLARVAFAPPRLPGGAEPHSNVENAVALHQVVGGSLGPAVDCPLPNMEDPPPILDNGALPRSFDDGKRRSRFEWLRLGFDAQTGAWTVAERSESNLHACYRHFEVERKPPTLVEAELYLAALDEPNYFDAHYPLDDIAGRRFRVAAYLAATAAGLPIRSDDGLATPLSADAVVCIERDEGRFLIALRWLDAYLRAMIALASDPFGTETELPPDSVGENAVRQIEDMTFIERFVTSLQDSIIEGSEGPSRDVFGDTTPRPSERHSEAAVREALDELHAACEAASNTVSRLERYWGTKHTERPERDAAIDRVTAAIRTVLFQFEPNRYGDDGGDWGELTGRPASWDNGGPLDELCRLYGYLPGSYKGPRRRWNTTFLHPEIDPRVPPSSAFDNRNVPMAEAVLAALQMIQGVVADLRELGTAFPPVERTDEVKLGDYPPLTITSRHARVPAGRHGATRAQSNTHIVEVNGSEVGYLTSRNVELLRRLVDAAKAIEAVPKDDEVRRRWPELRKRLLDLRHSVGAAIAESVEDSVGDTLSLRLTRPELIDFEIQ